MALHQANIQSGLTTYHDLAWPSNIKISRCICNIDAEKYAIKKINGPIDEKEHSYMSYSLQLSLTEK